MYCLAGPIKPRSVRLSSASSTAILRLPHRTVELASAQGAQSRACGIGDRRRELSWLGTLHLLARSCSTRGWSCHSLRAVEAEESRAATPIERTHELRTARGRRTSQRPDRGGQTRFSYAGHDDVFGCRCVSRWFGVGPVCRRPSGDHRARRRIPAVRAACSNRHPVRRVGVGGLRAAGVSFDDRQDLLGHKSGRITTHYPAAELSNLIVAAGKSLRTACPANLPQSPGFEGK